MVTQLFKTPRHVKDAISEVVCLKGDRPHNNYGLVIPKQSATPHFLLYFGSQGRISKPKMEYSLMFRITEKPQNLLSIKNHPHIDEIVEEIRTAYEAELWLPLWIPTTFQRVSYIADDGTPSYDGHFFMPIAHIYPFAIDLCKKFETTLKKYDAVKTLENEGWEMVRSNLNGRRAMYQQFDM